MYNVRGKSGSKNELDKKPFESKKDFGSEQIWVNKWVKKNFIQNVILVQKISVKNNLWLKKCLVPKKFWVKKRIGTQKKF